MVFFNMDEFIKDAEDSTIIPHPLAEKLSLEAKISYFGMIVFAALIDDGELDASEKEAMRVTGLALRLQESESNDAVKTVTGLKSDSDKMAFVKESLQILSDRDTAMFLYCDMVEAMTAESALTDDAKKFLSGVAVFLKFSQKDLNFLKEYTAFFPGGRKPEAADVVYEYASQKLPDGLVPYFTPVLNPIHIPGGRLPSGSNEFCNGRFIIESQVTLGLGSTLLVKNAEIEFGIDGWLEIEDGDAEFFDSKLTAVKGQTEKKDETPVDPIKSSTAKLLFPYWDFNTEKKDETPVHLIKSSAAKLLFSNCDINGEMTRAAIVQEHHLRMRDCRFHKLRSPGEGCVSGGDVSCDHCTFDNCSGRNIVGSSGSSASVNIRKTRFVLCSATDNIVADDAVQTTVLYKKCKSVGHLWFVTYWRNSGRSKNICCIDCVGEHDEVKMVDYDTWKKAFDEKESEEETSEG